MEQILFNASMIVAFLSGMIALFAPCCITFLLPAYIGQIFRARATILLGTIFFGLGIATIMLPITLGFRALVTVFQEFHTITYVAGGLLMVFFGVWTIAGKEMKIPFFIKSPKLSGAVEMTSLYSLGVFGGITSACCAPVLMGAIVLAGLSATFFKTLMIGLSYTAGIVFPLFIGALLWESNPLEPLRAFFTKSVKVLLPGIRGNISLGNVISGAAFVLFGATLAILALFGKIAMPQSTGRAGAVAGWLVVKLGSFLKEYQYVEYVFFGILIILFIFLIKRVRNH